jgi:hypothetical protein
VIGRMAGDGLDAQRKATLGREVGRGRNGRILLHINARALATVGI